MQAHSYTRTPKISITIDVSFFFYTFFSDMTEQMLSLHARTFPSSAVGKEVKTEKLC